MANERISVELQLTAIEDVALLFGAHDKYLRLIEDMLDVRLTTRGEKVQISGEKKQVTLAKEVLQTLQKLLHKKIEFHSSEVISLLKMSRVGKLHMFINMYAEEILKTSKGQTIRVKNLGQKEYVEKIKRCDIVFGIGPAGVGKTFLAVVLAIAALKQNEIKRIILTRPAVEAGESLGFLPGDLKEKVDPYLRPVYDALYAIFGKDQTDRLMERGVIEIAPLAYMRGRTLDDAFVILDEAQNTTVMQMKMFLTRLGFNSKMIVNGDTSQIDLPQGQISGLIHAEQTLNTVKGIGFVHFDDKDVVRHPVVAEIIRAYNLKGGV